MYACACVCVCVCVCVQDLLDYSVDSDEEWEEEDPGESISDSEVRPCQDFQQSIIIITRSRERQYPTQVL